MENSSIQIVKPERETQQRVIALFRDTLKYRYLGNRSDRANSNIDDELLAAHLVQSGYTLDQISRAICLLRVEAENLERICHIPVRYQFARPCPELPSIQTHAVA